MNQNHYNVKTSIQKVPSLWSVWKFNYQMREKKVIMNVIYRPPHGIFSLFWQENDCLIAKSKKIILGIMMLKTFSD